MSTLVPESIAARLRELGPGASLAQVQALYEPLLAAQSHDGVRLMSDLVYGPHERHRVDLYCPEFHPAPCPVFVWLHGGGFIRGDKAMRANIGWWGAQQGFVVALPNYRLAPAARWPSGPEDVVRLWHWLRSNVAAHGGDPGCIVLGGESAGAAHVAAATLMRRFQPPDWDAAGAALLSGPYNARLEDRAARQLGIAAPDPRNEAYFGADRSTWGNASIVDGIDAAPCPLWIGTTERDLPQMQIQGAELFARLVCGHGFEPELALLREHNHFSAGCSIGTPDESVSALLARFIRRCARTPFRASDPARASSAPVPRRH